MDSMDSSSRQFRSSRVAAFSLIELLVVLAIIALLVAILGPSVTGILDRAKGVTCENNLHELAKMMRQDTASSVPGDLPRPKQWTDVMVARGGDDILLCPEDNGQDSRDGGNEADLSDIWLVQGQGSSTMFSNLQMILDTGHSAEDRQISKVSAAHGYSAKPGQALIKIGSECALARVTFRGEVKLESLIINQTHNGHRSTHWFCLDDGLPNWRQRVTQSFYQGGSDPNVFVMRLQGQGHSKKWPDFELGYEHASYAMNNAIDVRSPRLGQLMLVEYKKPVAYVRKEGYAVDDLGDDNYDERGCLRTRHLGKANVAMTDGSVKGFTREELQAQHDMYTVADPRGLWAP